MVQIASETGGKAFQNTNDLTQAMQMAAELSLHYYLLSYSPKKQTHDGAFRSIKVLLDRRDTTWRTGVVTMPSTSKRRLLSRT